MKILMVCLGNICRSPLAEGILQDKINKAGLNWQVDSAGTNGYHVGEAPHRLSQKVARMNGIDISGQLSRKFIKEDFERFDLAGRTVRPVWLSIDVPATTPAGVYRGILEVATEKYHKSLAITILVQHQVLPDPAHWQYQLDLWQNPWIIAWYNHARQRPFCENQGNRLSQWQ